LPTTDSSQSQQDETPWPEKDKVLALVTNIILSKNAARRDFKKNHAKPSNTKESFLSVCDNYINCCRSSLPDLEEIQVSLPHGQPLEVCLANFQDALKPCEKITEEIEGARTKVDTFSEEELKKKTVDLSKKLSPVVDELRYQKILLEAIQL